MSKLIIANWKMNPSSLEDARLLARESDTDGLVVCPPFLYLEAVRDELNLAGLGAQDLFWEENGAYTGEISPFQLKNIGVRYAIIGHSERRQYLGETDEMVAKKVKACLDFGITPILCVGETKKEHNDNKAQEVVEREVMIGLSLVGGRESLVVIAYEPIWAIGSGIPDDPENTVKMAEFIRKTANADVPVLYGGSVTPENADDFLRQKEISGALVGGASLRGESIKAITRIANSVVK